ncbi:MAG: hypothetical protein ABSD70_15765 [Terracidiphilus sp.]|jgi:hypothetical protein
MKAAIFLRIAAVVALIHAILHTIGGVFAKPTPGPAERAVAAMKANHFVLMGSTRTYWDFYLGFGLAITIFLTVEAVAFWLLGSLALRESARLRPLISVFALAYLALAANSCLFFFAGPIFTEVMIVLCLALAVIFAKGPTTKAADVSV